jgi:hypothetical protein
MITESTALRLAVALERLVNLMEHGGRAMPTPTIANGSERVARAIMGGPDAVIAENKRMRRARRGNAR